MAEIDYKENKGRIVKCKIEEILKLDALDKSPKLITDITNNFSGNTDYKIISNLEEKNLISKRMSSEELEYLTILDLKVILKSISRPISGTKNELIDRINEYADDKDIASSIEKRYFVLTEMGLEVLNKYSNVIWIANYKDYIYDNPIHYDKKFTESYFKNHWDIPNPAEAMIDYYRSKDSGIVARLYKLNNNLEQAFYYSIKNISEIINFQIELCKDTGWFAMDQRLNKFCIWDMGKIFNSLSIIDENLDEILKYIYEYSIEHTDLITFDVYRNIIVTSLNKDDDLHEELVRDLCFKIRKKFNHEFNNEVYSYKYNKPVEEDIEESLLEILYTMLPDTDIEEINNKIIELIDDLDFGLINKIKTKVNKRLLDN